MAKTGFEGYSFGQTTQKKSTLSRPGPTCSMASRSLVQDLLVLCLLPFTIKKAECRRTDAFKLWCWRRLLRILLDWKEIKLVNPKGNQPWIFLGKTDTEDEAAILWPPDVKSWLIGKDPDAGKDWRQKEKGVTGDEMVGWHYWLNGHEFKQTLGDSEGQGSMACCSPWGDKELDITGWLKNKSR